LFEVVVSTQEAIEGLLKVGLSLFYSLHVKNVDPIDPLMWWATNESRFPNMGFLAQQILGIPCSQIETKRIFSIVGVFISLQ
jgi:hypothetical protein